MLKLLGTTSAIAALATLNFLNGNVAQAASIHVQEAAQIHVQEAELQQLESAGMETVTINGEVAHVFLECNLCLLVLSNVLKNKVMKGMLAPISSIAFGDSLS